MENRISLTPILKQQNRVIITQKIRKCLYILQLSALECKKLIQEELEKNPVLEELPNHNHKYNYSYHTMEPVYNISLFDHCMQQAAYHFSKKELKIAENIIGNLDENGFYSSSIEDLAKKYSYSVKKINAILSIIQSFEPSGIAAKNLQQSLLIQLEHKDKKNGLAYKIVKEHFDLLINGRLHEMQKKLKLPIQIIKKSILIEILKLNFKPSLLFKNEPPQTIIPDVIVHNEENKWTITINETTFPKVIIHPNYINLFSTSNDVAEKKFLQEKINQGQWLLHSLENRKKTLFNITKYILKKQNAFFLGNKDLVPMNIKEIALHLNISISTVARAISNKYISSKRGIFSFKKLFNSHLKTMDNDEISSQSVMNFLQKYISEENKTSPFSDKELSSILNKNGIKCARRTITKYRKKLKLPAAGQRKRKYLL